MPDGIMILGASGVGKTTLGRITARKLGFAFLDIDDFIWRKDTELPFTVLYSREEKIRRLMAAVEKAGKFVMAGSMSSFHEYFDQFFRLAVFLTADEKIRTARVHEREVNVFGERVLPGGDMYQKHQEFLRDVAGYENGTGSCTRLQHEQWMEQLSCPILRLDGMALPEENAEIIVKAYRAQ